MFFIDVHVWTYCRNMSVVKILRVLAKAGGGVQPPDNSNTADTALD